MGIRLKAEIPLVSDDRNLLQNQSSLIQQNADNILLRVAQSDYNGNQIVSRINLAPSSVKIEAKNIDISGLVTITNFTYANLGGTKPPVDADRTSTVIDGGLITTGTIQVGSGSTVRAGMQGGGTANNEVRFWAGETSANRNIAPFRVTQDGQLFATNANISGNSVFSGEQIIFNKVILTNPPTSIYGIPADTTLGIESMAVVIRSETNRSFLNVAGTVEIGGGAFGSGVLRPSPNNFDVDIGTETERFRHLFIEGFFDYRIGTVGFRQRDSVGNIQRQGNLFVDSNGFLRIT